MLTIHVFLNDERGFVMGSSRTEDVEGRRMCSSLSRVLPERHKRGEAFLSRTTRLL